MPPHKPNVSPPVPRLLSDVSDDVRARDVKKNRRRARADFIAEVAALMSRLQDRISSLKTSERWGKKSKARVFFPP